MSDLENLIDRYCGTWNETDAARRLIDIRTLMTEDIRYIDPTMQAQGHEGLSKMIDGVQERFPDHRISRTTAVDAHNNCVRFGWQLAPANGEPVVVGTDFCTLSPDGRLSSVTGFFDRPATAADDQAAPATG